MPQGINTGEILEALNDKMDRDGHNVQSPSVVIIETYDDGNGNGYILYSNNWCTQYGFSAISGRAGSQISLLKPMADTNYNVQALSYLTWDKTVVCSAVSTTYVQIAFSSSASGNIYWKVEGYIA